MLHQENAHLDIYSWTLFRNTVPMQAVYSSNAGLKFSFPQHFFQFFQLSVIPIMYVYMYVLVYFNVNINNCLHDWHLSQFPSVLSLIPHCSRYPQATLWTGITSWHKLVSFGYRHYHIPYGSPVHTQRAAGIELITKSTYGNLFF